MVLQHFLRLGLLVGLAVLLPACGSGDTGAAEPEAASTAEESGAVAGADEATTGTEEVIELVIAHTVSTADAMHVEALETAELIEERTDGRVQIEVFADGQMGGFDEMMERVERGENLITQQIPGFAVNYGVPEVEILTGPFLFDGYEDIQTLVASDLFQGWQERLHDEGIATLAWNWYFGKRHLIGDEPYPEPEDLEGVSVRVPTTPMWVRTFEALPSTPITIEFAELYTAMEQGVVDAAEVPVFAMLTLGFAEVADHMTLTGHFDNINTWTMNAELFDSLPADVQDILIEEFQAGGERQTEMVASQEDEQRAELEQEHGVTFVEADVDAYREMTRPVYDQFEEWPPGLYEEVLAAMGKS